MSCSCRKQAAQIMTSNWPGSLAIGSRRHVAHEYVVRPVAVKGSWEEALFSSSSIPDFVLLHTLTHVRVCVYVYTCAIYTYTHEHTCIYVCIYICI